MGDGERLHRRNPQGTTALHRMLIDAYRECVGIRGEGEKYEVLGREIITYLVNCEGVNALGMEQVAVREGRYVGMEGVDHG